MKQEVPDQDAAARRFFHRKKVSVAHKKNGWFVIVKRRPELRILIKIRESRENFKSP
jgi:hypothetical protein